MPEVLQQFSEGIRRKTLTSVQWRQVVGKSVPWKDLENDGKRTMCTWDLGILPPSRAG